MEKLELLPASLPEASAQTLRERFVRPYGELTIQRRLKHFDTSLGLEPGVAGYPDGDFLTRLFTGHRSHAAMLRKDLGQMYKNFENLVRERNETSAVTLILLARKLGTSEEEIMSLVHGNRSGPLLPQFLELLQGGEGLLSWSYFILTDGVIPCECCGNNLLDDTDAWWRRVSSEKLNMAEYQFAERILAAVMGGRVIRYAIQCLSNLPGIPSSARHLDMATPNQHPVGNWLKLVRQSYGCSNSLELEAKLAALEPSTGPLKAVPQQRLNKWACGDDLIPMDLANSIVKSRHNAQELELALIESRALAFIQEFIGAAVRSEKPPEAGVVRAVVFQRMRQMNIKLHMSIRQRFKLDAPLLVGDEWLPWDTETPSLIAPAQRK